jgi:hypothetical protein
MPLDHIIATLLEHAKSQSKSTILRPLSWLTSICVVAILGAVRFNGPKWLLIVLAVNFCLTVALYLGSFIFCLSTGQIDALRTEKYSLEKLAMERGFRGDSSTGLFRIGKPPKKKPLPLPETDSGEEEQKR